MSTRDAAEMSTNRGGAPSTLALWPLWLAFFLSGMAGLSYELVWVRYVGRIVGGSTEAIAVTVAIFFGGLALGSWVAGRVFARSSRPLFAYALLEASIGLTAAMVPAALRWLESASAEIDSLPLAFATVTLILLPPTALIGATFPAMARTLAGLRDAVSGTASFYGLNTAGAVAGCILTSFFLLPTLGHRQTNWVMVGLDLAVAAVLVALSLRRTPQRTATPAGSTVAEERSVERSATAGGGLPFALALGLAAASGFFAIGVEVLWTRALALSFPVTVYVFAIVLAAYLFGIAIGALAMSRLARRFPPKALLLGLYIATAAGVLGSGLAFPLVSTVFYELVGRGVVSGWQGWIIGIGVTSLAAMLPATLAMGAALPLLIGLASHGRDRSRTAGVLYMANVAGGIAGSLATTFALMPAIGLSTALSLLGAAYLLLALLLARPAGLTRARLGLLGALALAAIGVALAGFGPDVDPDRAPGPDRRLLFSRDSASGTIAIYERGERGRAVPVRSLKVNNFYGLNITALATVAMQYRLGHLPLLLHPKPRSALLIGFATGNTLAAMADHGLGRLDCVELHGELFALARYFEAVNRRVWTRNNVHLYAGDGRRFILRKGPRYDVIVGDLYLPRNPGVGALYSREHFRAVKRRLRQGGVFVAWLPLWQLSPGETGVIIKTFLEVYPAARALLGNPNPRRPVLGLVAGPGVATDDRSELLEGLVSADLRRIYGDSTSVPPRAVAPPLRLGNPVLKRWAAGKPVNTLERPVIEYSAPITLTRYQLERRSPAADNLALIARLTASLRGH